MASQTVERAADFKPQWYKRFPAAARHRSLVSYIPYEGGGILVAGKAPQIGLAWDDPDMEAYRQAARVLEPVRTKNFEAYFAQEAAPGYIEDLPDRAIYLDQAHTRAWLARFSPAGGRPSVFSQNLPHSAIRRPRNSGQEKSRKWIC